MKSFQGSSFSTAAQLNDAMIVSKRLLLTKDDKTKKPGWHVLIPLINMEVGTIEYGILKTKFSSVF